MSRTAGTLGLVLALSTPGASWAQAPATAMSGMARVTSVDTGSGHVTLETDGTTGMELSGLNVGDQVRIETLSKGPEDGETPRSTSSPLLGAVGFAVVGAAIIFRLRRPRTI